MTYEDMTSPVVAGDVCRITVVGPRSRVDLAVPADVPFGYLFPVIARFAQVDGREAPDGWVLQRLGQRAFEPSATPASVGLLDGELIYLRPEAAQLPEMTSDDIADQVAAVHDGPGRWRGDDTRRAALGAGALALVAGAVVIERSAMPMPAAVAGLVTLLLLVAAASAARAIGDQAAGVTLGYCALPYAFLAGLAADGAARAGGLAHAGALGVLAGFAVTVLAAVLAAITVGLPAFLGPVAAALFGVLAAGLAVQWPRLGAPGAAAVVAAVALALMPVVPALAFRLAGVPLPAVPASADDLRDDALFAPVADVRPRAAAADRIVAGAIAAVGLTAAGAEIALGSGHGVLPRVTLGVLACAVLVRARVFPGRAQRLWLIIPGYGGLALLAIVIGQLSALVAVVAVAAVAVGVAARPRGHRASPFWRRAADVCDTLLVVALVPLALGVAGILHFLHGLHG